MVVDSSAILAILQREPEADSFGAAIARAEVRYISAVTVLEAGITAIKRHGAAGSRQVEDFIAATALRIVPFDAEQSSIAREAYERYGRGRHPARLNFGDCAAYALAKSLAMPLLFKGEDFARTDLARATGP